MRIIGLVFATLLSIGQALADNVPKHLPPDLREIAIETLADPDMTRALSTCPEKLWADHSLSPASFLPSCDGPRPCQALCALGAGQACFDLARMMQDLEPDMPDVVSERLFVKSCASGFVGGCTNRAAGILVRDEGDVFTSLPANETTQCAAKTFTITCQMDDAWGCAMHASDLYEGVIGERDVKAARAAAAKACKLDYDDLVGACSAARRWTGE